MASLREQIAARRTAVRNSPARPRPGAAPPVAALEDRTVASQVSKARRTGKLELMSMSLSALPSNVYTDLLGIPEDELSVPPAKPEPVHQAAPPKEVTYDNFGRAISALSLEDDDTARRLAFGTPPPKKRWSEPEELTSLRAPDNRILELEVEVGLFGGLKTLDLRNNRLSKLPDAVADLLKLTVVDISSNALTAFPPSLLLLPELESLNLSHNALATLDLTNPVKPSDVGLAYGVGFLISSFERVAKSPKTVLPVLRSLNLSYNSLENDTLKGLGGKGELKLRVLNLANNALSGVLDAAASGIDLARMPELASLVLAGNAHLNGLKGDIAGHAAVDTEACAWGSTGGSALSLGASTRRPSASPDPESPNTAAAAGYSPAPGGPTDIPLPTATVTFMTLPAATFDSLPLALEMDVYVPKDASATAPLPVVVWWHGGGLLQGNKENLPPHLRRLPNAGVNGEGVIVVSPNYRLAPQAAILDILADADAAVGYVRTKLNDKLAALGHAARVDPTRLVLSGGSAGGYLALMAGLPVPQRVQPADVGGHAGPVGWAPVGIASFYPITDLTHAFWATETDPVPWWGKSVPDAAARPHLNHRDPPVATAVSGGPRSILYPYMLQHGLFPNLLFYNQRSVGSGLDAFRPTPEALSATTRLGLLNKYEGKRPPVYMVYGSVDDKVQPLEETAALLKETDVVEVLAGADHAFDEDPVEQCPGFKSWLEGVLAR